MQWAQKQKGFTIVELLIVIVVIAILAAISIVAYNGISQRAKASSAQQALSDAQKKLAVYAVDNGDSYPTDISTLNLPSSGSVTYQYSAAAGASPTGYCITATTGGVAYYLGKNFAYTGSSSGTIDQPVAAAGACPGHGGASGTSITNLVPNPSGEVDVSTYSSPNSATRAQSSTRAYSGSKSVVVTLPANRASSNVGIGPFQAPTSYLALGLEPNTTYTFTAYVYVPSATPVVQISVQGTGRASVTNAAGRVSSAKDQWVRVQNQFTTTAADGTIFVYLLNDPVTPATTTQFWADAFMLTKGTDAYNFADGNSAGWIWNGTAGLASSTGPAL